MEQLVVCQPTISAVGTSHIRAADTSFAFRPERRALTARRAVIRFRFHHRATRRNSAPRCAPATAQAPESIRFPFLPRRAIQQLLLSSLSYQLVHLMRAPTVPNLDPSQLIKAKRPVAQLPNYCPCHRSWATVRFPRSASLQHSAKMLLKPPEFIPHFIMPQTCVNNIQSALTA